MSGHGSYGRAPVMIAALVLCGIIFVILKIFFPGRSGAWYMNRIKIIASIVMLIAGIVVALTF